jgi:hypothetical protein
MTPDQYLDKLVTAGYRHRLLWEAKEPGQTHPNVRSYVIYAPDGRLLTSVILRSFKATGSGTMPEVATYFCSENSSVEDDIEELKGLWALTIRKEKNGS